MYRRLGTRRAVGSRTAGGPPVDPLVAIFGSNLAEYWSAGDAAQSGGFVTSLTGRLQATVLSATGDPVFNASDAVLNSAASVGCTPFNCLSNTALGSLIPGGSRPCMWMIGYVSAVPVLEGDFSTFALRRSAGDWDIVFRILDDGGDDSPWYLRFYDGSLHNSNGPSAAAVDTPFVQAAIVDASAGMSFWMDGSSYGSLPAVTSAAPGAVDRLVIGANGVLTEGAYVTFAQAGVCLNPPTAGELAALYAYAQSNYGVP